MKKRIVLIGGSGFIGQSLARALNNKYHVCVADIVTPPANIDVSYVPFNFIKDDDYASLFKGANIVFHLACTTMPNDNTDRWIAEHEDNIIPTLRILDFLKDQKDTRLIFLSSAGTVYGEIPGDPAIESQALNPLCGYAVIKSTIEKYIQLYRHYYETDWIIARLSNPYGSSQNASKPQGVIPIFARKIMRGEPIVLWGNGENVRDYIYIDDAVEALSRLAEYRGGQSIFNISTGDGYTLNKLIELICEIGKLKTPEIYYSESRKCDLHRNVVEPSLIQRELGWKPEISLKEGIEITLRELMVDI